MQAKINEHGLYEVELEVIGKKKSKKIKGLIDTGSTDCVCTYKVVTTLQIRPIDFTKVHSIDTTKKRLVYEGLLRFDGHETILPIIRVEEIADGGDFIFGMSMLSQCTISYDGDTMQVDWKNKK